jgi:hypothetical protein
LNAKEAIQYASLCSELLEDSFVHHGEVSIVSFVLIGGQVKR